MPMLLFLILMKCLILKRSPVISLTDQLSKLMVSLLRRGSDLLLTNVDKRAAFVTPRADEERLIQQGVIGTPFHVTVA